MKSSILNSILNGTLKPWLIKFDDERVLKAIVKKTQNKPNSNVLEIKSNLQALLQPFPAMLKGTEYPGTETVQPLGYSTNLPQPETLVNHFYKALIDAEVVRYFNATIHNPLIQDNELDVPFQIGHQSLKGITDLCNQAINEIIEREFEANHVQISDTTFFALTYLRNSLFALYFSIQEPFKEYLPTVYSSLDEFTLHCLDKGCGEVQLIQPIKNTFLPTTIQRKSNEPVKFSFGWKGGSIENLQAVFDDLCIDIHFLDEERTSVKTLVELLTSKDVKAGEHKIYLGCKTTEFVLVMDAISKYFQRLTQTTIEQSKCFWSKPATNKPSTLISSTTISKSRTNGKTKDEVISDIKATIDKYLP